MDKLKVLQNIDVLGELNKAINHIEKILGDYVNESELITCINAYLEDNYDDPLFLCQGVLIRDLVTYYIEELPPKIFIDILKYHTDSNTEEIYDHIYHRCENFNLNKYNFIKHMPKESMIDELGEREVILTNIEDQYPVDVSYHYKSDEIVIRIKPKV